MWFSPGLLLLSLLTSGSASMGQRDPVPPGSPEDGDWAPFFSAGGEATIQQEFFYDRSRLRVEGGHVVSRWKVLNNIRGERSITMYAIDIDCRRDRMTETGTIIIEADGQSRELPRTELLVDIPIPVDTSTARFRQS